MIITMILPAYGNVHFPPVFGPNGCLAHGRLVFDRLAVDHWSSFHQLHDTVTAASWLRCSCIVLDNVVMKMINLKIPELCMAHANAIHNVVALLS